MTGTTGTAVLPAALNERLTWSTSSAQAQSVLPRVSGGPNPKNG